MTNRVTIARVAPQIHHTMRAFKNYVDSTGLEKSLLELVKLRASYMNGCAYCVDMHAKDAREDGEREVITNIAGGVSDQAHADARVQFGEKELADLTMAIITINSWNRLAIPFQSVVGSYKPLAHV